MKTIDIGEQAKTGRITVLSYGGMRTGKSRFGATWPRPLFLSDATEGGWTTIKNMDRSALFESDRLPIVWAIEKAADMMQALKDAEPLIRDGRVKTIVVDSLTFYTDLYMNALTAAHAGRTVDLRQLYQNLGQHLLNLRVQVHLLPVNVVWLCLVKEPGEDTPVGGPLLPGQNAAKFAAGCDYVLYHRSFHSQSNGQLQWEIRTRKFQSYQAGGRDEGLLPDPIGYYTQDEQGHDVFVPDCTYRTMADALGISADAEVTAVSGNGKGRKSVASPPPVANATAQPGRASR